jgi:pimeloyl-ACP methyl ester carboxylesterase
MTKNKSVFKNEMAKNAYIAAYDRTLESWPVPYESKFVSTSYGKTHVLVSGPEDGEPIVLMHGKGDSATSWIANVAALSSKHRVYAYDILGDVGKSTVEKPISNRSEFADWLTQVLDRLAIQKTYMVGLSMGSYLTINYALEKPERLKKIVLLAPAATFSSLTTSLNLMGMISTMFGFEFLIKRFNRSVIGSENLLESDVSKQVILGMKSWRLPMERPYILPEMLPDEDLINLEVPTLLVVGELDNVNRDSPAVVIERAENLIPNIQTIVVPSAGHTLNMSEPEVINSAILDFL